MDEIYHCGRTNTKTCAWMFLNFTFLFFQGYGNAHPSLSSSDGGKCDFQTFLTALEAFVGVLCAGFVSTIIFGKVLRVQSQAQVTFSDPILARFDYYDASANMDTIIPCPVVEFQIVNDCHNELGGEIIDAMVNCMSIKNDQKNVSTKNRIGINLNCSPKALSKPLCSHVVIDVEVIIVN